MVLTKRALIPQDVVSTEHSVTSFDETSLKGIASNNRNVWFYMGSTCRIPMESTQKGLVVCQHVKNPSNSRKDDYFCLSTFVILIIEGDKMQVKLNHVH